MIGFDIDKHRIAELSAGRDRTREVDPADLQQSSLAFTTDAKALREVDFFIVTVPTPIDDAFRPGLTAMPRPHRYDVGLTDRRCRAETRGYRGL